MSTATRSSVLAWIDDPDPERGIRFSDGSGGWDRRTYDELAAAARAAGHRIAANTTPGSVVTIALPSGPEFVAAFYGTQLAGRTPSCVVPSPDDAARETIARLIVVSGAAAVVTDARRAPLLREAVARAGRELPVLILGEALPDGGRLDEPRAELAVLQFTSGSTGTPKGVRVRWENLEANTDMVAGLFAADRDTHLATWLPLHHDMGLIGCLLTTVSRQGELSCLRPEHFVRRPSRWVDCLGREGASVSISPAFAFDYAAAKVSVQEARGLDLSGWRCALVGAERIGAAGLLRFAERFRPLGFDPRSFMPGYGMAEATLAVTCTSRDADPQAVRVDLDRLGHGSPVVLERRPLAGLRPVDRPEEWLLSSGPPLGDLEVRILGEDGTTVPDGHLGEVAIRGSGVVDGYEGAPDGQLTAFVDGELRSGDAGFLLDGELHVLGRMGDAVSARGRTVYLEDAEARLAELPDMPRGRFAVLAGPREVVLLVEGDAGPWVAPARAVLRQHVGDVAVSIRTTSRGAILRTSSGKPRRRQMWTELAAGRLPGVEAP